MHVTTCVLHRLRAANYLILRKRSQQVFSKYILCSKYAKKNYVLIIYLLGIKLARF